MTSTDVVRALRKKADKERAQVSLRFFKTGKGQYGEGDRFIGINVPDTRKIAKEYRTLPLPEVKKLLASKIHEERLTALMILIEQFLKADEAGRKKIFNIYVSNIRHINNWDLVDLSAPNIVGTYLLDKPREILYTLAGSKDLWKKRIAIVSTYTFIRRRDFEDTLKISEMLLSDRNDLIHKAVGWMLREVGKKDEVVLRKFLDTHYFSLPRTALRYAIERFPEEFRVDYLKRK